MHHIFRKLSDSQTAQKNSKALKQTLPLAALITIISQLDTTLSQLDKVETSLSQPDSVETTRRPAESSGKVINRNIGAYENVTVSAQDTADTPRVVIL